MSACLMCGCGEFTALFHGSDRLYHTTTKQFSVVSCDVCGLLRLDLEVADDTRAILIHRDVERALRRSRRGLLPLRFVLEQLLRRKIVFNILNRGEHSLPVNGDGRVVTRNGLRFHGTTRASIEYRQCERRTHGPESHRPRQPLLQMCRLKAGITGQR